jgi:hypothetical protein
LIKPFKKVGDVPKSGGLSRSSGVEGFSSKTRHEDECELARHRRLSPGVDYRFNQYCSPITHKSRTTVLEKYYRRGSSSAMKISISRRFFQRKNIAEKTADLFNF